MLLLLLSLAAFAADPAALLDETRSRARSGDFDGAVITARQASDIPGPHESEALYLLALSLEYAGELEQALALYDRLLAESSEPDDDVVFRRAEALGGLGRVAEAQRALRDLGEIEDRRPGDQVKIRTVTALWDLERGRTRRGLRALWAMLDAAPADASPFYQAKARGELVRRSVEGAAEIAFEGNDRRKARALEERAVLVGVAKEQTRAILALDEVAHTLPALLQVGLAHEQFAEAMLAEPPIRRLSAEEQARYDAQIAEKAVALLLKARAYYAKALEYAGMVGWGSSPVPDLRAGAARVEARIERLDP